MKERLKNCAGPKESKDLSQANATSDCELDREFLGMKNTLLGQLRKPEGARASGTAAADFLVLMSVLCLPETMLSFCRKYTWQSLGQWCIRPATLKWLRKTKSHYCPCNFSVGLCTITKFFLEKERVGPLLTHGTLINSR